MAEKLIAHALAAQPRPWCDLRVISAGVSAMPGQPASANSVKALARVGLDLSQHRSTQVTSRIMETSAALFCMTESHRRILRGYFPTSGTPVHLMREFMPSSADPQIPDPYGSSLDAYMQCRDSMVEALPSLIDFIMQLDLPD
jgi:protein-tyrosine phosphatase